MKATTTTTAAEAEAAATATVELASLLYTDKYLYAQILFSKKNFKREKYGKRERHVGT